MRISPDERLDGRTPAPEPEPDVAGDVRLTWLRRAVWAVLLAGVLAFLVQGADNPPDPELVPAADSSTTSTDVDAQVEVEDEFGRALGEVALPAPSATTSSSPMPASPSPTPSDATPPPPLEETSTTVTTTAVVRRPLPGFAETPFRVTDAEGGVVDGVALLASDEASRRRGLMEQSDLRGYDAMVFRFPSPTTGTFFMRNTRIPLSIAFFDLYGRFVSSTDMEPCPDQEPDCPSYSAAGPYVHAVEMAQGDLGRFGIGPGSVLSFPSS